MRLTVGGAAGAPAGGLRSFTGAVGAAHRLPCDARVAGCAAELTTCPFGALRSNSCGKLEVEARASHAQPATLRFSAPQRRTAALRQTPRLWTRRAGFDGAETGAGVSVPSSIKRKVSARRGR